MANFELQTRVPMMIRAPWLRMGGRSTTAMTELVDMCVALLLQTVREVFHPSDFIVIKMFSLMRQVPDRTRLDWAQR